jgi:hypothetical protein
MAALLPSIGSSPPHVDVPAVYQPNGSHRFTYGVVIPVRGLCAQSRMSFAELGRRRRNDSLGATHDAWAYQ